MSNKALEKRIRVLETKVRDLTPKSQVTPKAVKVRMITCSWAAAPFQGDEKCGWIGRSDKYEGHLKRNHGGKEYKKPVVGR